MPKNIGISNDLEIWWDGDANENAIWDLIMMTSLLYLSVYGRY
jgi:hypothetical protein